MPPQAAELALYEIGMHGLGCSLKQRFVFLVVMQPLQAGLCLGASPAERCRFFGKNFVAEQIKP